MKILQVTTIDSTIYAFLIPHILNLQKEGYKVNVACSCKKYKEIIESQGIKIFCIPFSRKPISFLNFKAFFCLLRLLHKEKYEILHTHTPVASFISRIVAKIARVPIVIYMAHEFPFHNYGNFLSNFFFYLLEKFAGIFTDIFITINKDNYKIAKKIFPRKTILYIKGGVGINTLKYNPDNIDPLELLKLRKESKIAINERIVGIIAELYPRKRHIDFLMAAKIILKENNNIKFLIIGKGILLEYIKKLVKKLEIEENIIFTGFVKETVKLNLLALMDVFVLPSLREGFGIVTAEAMCMKKPVIATNTSGSRELIIDGVTGKLVPTKNPKTIASSILEILKHPEIAKKMGEAGRRRIIENFDEKIVLERELKIYQQLINENLNKLKSRFRPLNIKL